MKKTLTYDDILLVPQYSEIKSLGDISLKTNVTRRYGLLNPYVATCMNSICESEMAITLMKVGGVGCIHRFSSVDEQCNEVIKVKNFIKDNHMYEEWGVMYDDWHSEIADIPVIATIGVMDDDLERAKKLIDSGVNILLIDVVHGHHINVKNMLTNLKSIIPSYVDIIVGNICTTKAAADLCEWGADGIKVGGVLCSNITQTGYGTPNVTSISDCVDGTTVPIIADGVIRNSGDIAKALSFGADCVMLDSLLDGDDNFFDVIIDNDDILITLNNLTYSLKSALSYSGSKDLNNFFNDSYYIELNQSGLSKSKPK